MISAWNKKKYMYAKTYCQTKLYFGQTYVHFVLTTTDMMSRLVVLLK